MSNDSSHFVVLATQMGVRETKIYVEETWSEAQSQLEKPVVHIAATAVVKNPWVGGSTDADLSEEVQKLAPVLAKVLCDKVLASAGGAENLIAFGKAAFVGEAGELEHAAALIHTPFFGNLVREMLGGTSVLCFTDGRIEPGAAVRVPMWHKTEAGLRDFYQTVEVPLGAAPNRDEICVVVAASTGTRPFPRIGDRTTDPSVTSEILKGF